jgi:hypothetical protein
MPLKPELTSELRGMVREVLRDVMAQRARPSFSAVEAVRIASDEDLSAFIARLLDPATLEQVRSGGLRFALAGIQGPAGPAAAGTGAGALTGVVTEQKINRQAGQGRIVLAPGAVLTPLARDRARKLGLTIERRR